MGVATRSFASTKSLMGPRDPTRVRPVARPARECDILALRFSLSWRWDVGRNGFRISMAMAAAIFIASPTAAQTPSLQDSQVTDIETMKDKFVGLADAFDATQYDWRPMEGVRSVRDVLGLIVAEAHVFPMAWGHEPPARAASGFGPEIQRVGELSRAETINEVGLAFDHLIGVVRGMDDTERMAGSEYFGRPMQIAANSMTAMADMHEHLGQLIAYARTNHVVPPWSL